MSEALFAEARDKRYELAKPEEKRLASYLGLTPEAFAALPTDERADLTEFFFNAHTEVLRVLSPLDASMKELERARHQVDTIRQGLEAAVRESTDKFITEREGGLTKAKGVWFVAVNTALAIAYKKLNSEIGFISKDEQAELTRVAFALAERAVSTGTSVPDGALLETFERLGPTRNVSFDGQTYPIHDGMHVLEKMRRKGKDAELPKFLTAERPEDNYKIEVMREELFPVLFLPVIEADGDPLPPVMLREPKHRESAASTWEVMATSDSPEFNATILRLVTFLRNPPAQDVPSRIKEYETYLMHLIRVQAIHGTILTSEGELGRIDKAFAGLKDSNRPPDYLAFAKRVFSDELLTNPRIFVDEVLNGIRSQT